MNAAQGDRVSLLPGLFQERMKLNEEYLMSLDTGCLLQNFYLEAGIIPEGCQVIPDPDAARMHWGWEAPSCQLRGHFLGHWLSAASMLAQDGKHPQLRAKIDFVVSELARCQRLNGGEWVGSIPEKYFDMLVKGQYIWSPQYTMHKTLMGLKDVHALLGNETALEILDHLADWYLRWVQEAKKTNPAAIYGGEQAGMLEIWADLYDLTRKEKYLTLIQEYQENGLFSRLDAGSDALTDDHANASIPLSHGIGRMYELSLDPLWQNRMHAFWKTAVTDRGMLPTTGSNSGEFWVPPHSHASYLGQTTQEFCTVYNMVRTAEFLYRWTGDTRYADYIEQALYNGFLAQQSPETGMPTYFLPTVPGSRKKWGSRTRDFWCCHGTMVQAQALYPRLIWYTDPEQITVSQYIPSQARLDLEPGEVFISQVIQMKNYNAQVLFDEHSEGRTSRWSLRFEVKTEMKSPWTLRLRIPGWCTGMPVLALNGETIQDPEIRDGYLCLHRVWEEDTIDVLFPSIVHFEPVEGAEELTCAMEGPIVLAGLTEKDAGIQGDLSSPEKILLPDNTHTYGTFVWTQSHYRTRLQRENFPMVPLYEINNEPYTLFFTHQNHEG